MCSSSTIKWNHWNDNKIAEMTAFAVALVFSVCGLGKANVSGVQWQRAEACFQGRRALFTKVNFQVMM